MHLHHAAEHLRHRSHPSRVTGLLARYVHIGESHRGYLGTGSVPWEPFWRGLAEMGYTGPLTFESFSSAVASKSLSQTLCVWRDLYAP